MTDHDHDHDEIDDVWTALTADGWASPHMAHAADYDSVEDLQDADRETNRLNRRSLDNALSHISWLTHYERNAVIDALRSTAAAREARGESTALYHPMLNLAQRLETESNAIPASSDGRDSVVS